MQEAFDVVIVGGGPAGSTVGSMLKKHAPHLSVLILEREVFPRDHIGESLLPTTGRILDEIGAWDKIEAANFPIKIGATYRWGSSDDLWDFNLLETAEVNPLEKRPGKYEGWRMRSTWQVERGPFDKILLDHSAELGCVVREGVAVTRVEATDGAVKELELSDGSKLTARFYVDASGNAGILRRGLGIETEEPNALRNIAFWDYWEDADWAVTIGAGATRIQIMSLGYGWIWFIPVTSTRTSIGLVCPADYYKQCGKRPEELYAEAVRSEPRIAALTAAAKRDGEVRATRDWSFLARQMAGPNWFLVGEAAGFADPILSAGITIAMVGAKECAYTIAELDRGEVDAEWMRLAFEKRQRQRVYQHIQFANYWYSGNRHFSELVEYTSEIARGAGLNMSAESAWQWIGTGGFVSLETAGAGLAGHSIEQIKNIEGMLFNSESEWQITKVNVFDLNIEDVVPGKTPIYEGGRIRQGRTLRKGDLEIPVSGGFRVILEILQRETKLGPIIRALRDVSAKMGPIVALSGLEALEVLLKDGWISGVYSPDQPLLRPEDIPRTPNIDWNRDTEDPMVRMAAAIEG
ncbi:NAD(P)/FAD-dependent oxidoreductase [Fimbriimonas ginsengisoli]|uniref:Halogenase n=1 Tax=Fimbriimonas ginsengisoli Gsoil 348 TaxID=661478 RepID=A0A068NSQ5_FIMGI|nr:NAD(P)/FAD-dependent oxidoreductase [Fimbriimonas ginsengisoli]AIE85810.1 halogenase [Fimbriimonas ginsengisoli Gsoil 348]